MESRQEEIKCTRMLRRHGPNHRTALITAMGLRRGKSHENQLPSLYGDMDYFFDVSGNVCYCLSIVINLKAIV
jgi:hypothetical protein